MKIVIMSLIDRHRWRESVGHPCIGTLYCTGKWSFLPGWPFVSTTLQLLPPLSPSLLLTRCWLSVTVVSRCTDHAADKRHAPCKSKNWHTTHTLKHTHAHSVDLQIVTHSAMNHGGRTRNNQSQLCLELTIDLSGSDKKHQQIQGMTAWQSVRVRKRARAREGVRVGARQRAGITCGP